MSNEYRAARLTEEFQKSADDTDDTVKLTKLDEALQAWVENWREEDEPPVVYVQSEGRLGSIRQVVGGILNRVFKNEDDGDNENALG